jgi:hypothetical protein
MNRYVALFVFGFCLFVFSCKQSSRKDEGAAYDSYGNVLGPTGNSSRPVEAEGSTPKADSLVKVDSVAKPDAVKPAPVIARRYAPVPVPQNTSFHDVFRSCRYVQLETNKNCLLGRIWQLLAHDGKIFILSGTHAVYCFDLNGRFLYSVNHQGKGPDEYLSIASICLEDTVLYLNTPKKIMCYRLRDGVFIKSIPIEFYNKFLVVDRNFVYLQRFMASGDKGGSIMVCDLSQPGSAVRYFLDGPRFSMSLPDLFTAGLGQGYFVDPYFNQVYLFRDGEMWDYVKFDFGSRNLSMRAVEEMVANKRPPQSEKWASGLSRVRETSRFMVASFEIEKILSVILTDKTRGKSVYYSFENLRDSLTPLCAIPLDFEAATERGFLAFVPEGDIPYHKKAIEGMQLDARSPYYANYMVLRKHADDSNPILAIYEINEDVFK